jgi:hypothetical protein
MPEPTSIVAMIAAIKHSIDLVKAVKDADYDLDKSILKEKIAILVDSLLEAKIQASETLDEIQEKDDRIAELEGLLKFKEKLVRKDGMYFEADENGDSTGDPYCSGCWESEKKAIHLTLCDALGDDTYFRCLDCKNNFGEPYRGSSSSRM